MTTCTLLLSLSLPCFMTLIADQQEVRQPVGHQCAVQVEDAGRVLRGTWVEMNGKECAIEIMGARKNFMLAADAKVVGPDGQPVKTSAIKAGQAVRITVKRNEPLLAVQIDVLNK